MTVALLKSPASSKPLPPVWMTCRDGTTGLPKSTMWIHTEWILSSPGRYQIWRVDLNLSIPVHEGQRKTKVEFPLMKHNISHILVGTCAPSSLSSDLSLWPFRDGGWKPQCVPKRKAPHDKRCQLHVGKVFCTNHTSGSKSLGRHDLHQNSWHQLTCPNKWLGVTRPHYFHPEASPSSYAVWSEVHTKISKVFFYEHVVR
jgi:hypothetical protein